MKNFNYREYLAEGWMFKEAGQGKSKYTFEGFRTSRGQVENDIKRESCYVLEPITMSMTANRILDLPAEPTEDSFYEGADSVFDCIDEELYFLQIKDEQGKVVWRINDPNDLNDVRETWKYEEEEGELDGISSELERFVESIIYGNSNEGE